MNNLYRLTGIDLNLLVVFESVLTEGTVHQAARRLGITQPAVSHALRRLREQLGDPLLIKTSRGMVPTVRASQLAESVRRALQDIDGALHDGATFDPGRVQRTFTLSSADYAESVLLPPLYRTLAQKAPQLRLQVRAPFEGIFAALESGALDLAFGVFRQAPAACRRQVLFSDRFVCLLRKGHPIGRGRLTLERYLELEHITVAPVGTPGTLLDDALARKRLQRRIALVVPHFLLAPLMVAETDLALTLPERLARRYVRLLGLRMATPPVELDEFSISQIWHERQHHDPVHAWLRQRIAELIARPRSADAGRS